MIQGKPDAKLFIAARLLFVREGQESDFVKCIGCIGYKLSQEDVLVGVQGVDQDLHQTIDLSLEREGLCILPECKVLCGAHFLCITV